MSGNGELGAIPESLMVTTALTDLSCAAIFCGQRKEKVADQHGVVFGVGDGVGDLLRREPDIDRMKYRPHHRDGEIGLQISVRVDVDDGDLAPLLDAEVLKARRQTVHSLEELGPGVAFRSIDDLALPSPVLGLLDQGADSQRIIV